MSALRSNIAEIPSVFRIMQQASDNDRKRHSRQATLAADKAEHK